MTSLSNIFWLGLKELRAFLSDRVLFAFVLYVFSIGIWSEAVGIKYELHNAAIAVSDLDQSEASRRLIGALLPPQFKTPVAAAPGAIGPGMNVGQFTFALSVPPGFQADLERGRRPEVQVDVDATAVMQAGVGSAFITNVLSREIAGFLTKDAQPPSDPITLASRVAFNPNKNAEWFLGVMALINYTTMLTVVLTGAALIREREHGTIDHLLVMPLTPVEIMAAKLWANGLVVLACVATALILVIQGGLGARIAGSIPLFLTGVALYLAFGGALGILLATIARSMPQFGLLFMLVLIPLLLLSGATTPIESMPPAMQVLVQVLPSTHFVAFAQAILYRGAGLDVVWREFAIVSAMGALVFALALARFRVMLAAAGS